jgi:hypothetical protein
MEIKILNKNVIFNVTFGLSVTDAGKSFTQIYEIWFYSKLETESIDFEKFVVVRNFI